ncbi:hypothetical protein HF086_006755 [Spodoptera exigua]|uniref:Septin-type G domain-containing protein n=1 Tax=Spodoptera exigua TaxID=7107 RepID=A0A922M7B3_SPOEX|nr:hypothetical protein HF086_006755 [Spodoptera exigua]
MLGLPTFLTRCTTVKLDASTVEIEERGVKLRLTVVDTPGYGDAIDNTDCFRSIIQYIDEQFERFLRDESGLNRRNIVDNRIHCCFYFISPLKPLDIEFMKQLHNKVNIVPVIAKADCLTKKEVQRLKTRVMEEIEREGIKIYPLPDCDSDEDEDYKEQVRQLKAAVPFAVCGAGQQLEVRGRRVRGRLYPWGVVEVENPEHCDFIKLRTMLMERNVTNERSDETKICWNNRNNIDFKYMSTYAGSKNQADGDKENYPNKNKFKPRVEHAHAGPAGGDAGGALRELQVRATRAQRTGAQATHEAELRRMQEMLEQMQRQMNLQAAGGASTTTTA